MLLVNIFLRQRYNTILKYVSTPMNIITLKGQKIQEFSYNLQSLLRSTQG